MTANSRTPERWVPKYELARHLCSTNVFADEEKRQIMHLAKLYCNNDPHNNQAALWRFIVQASNACD